MFKGNSICRGLINSSKYFGGTLRIAHGVLGQAVKMFPEAGNHVKETTILQNIRGICILEDNEDGL